MTRERATGEGMVFGFVYLQPKYILWTYVSLANPPYLQKTHKKHNKNFKLVVTSANTVSLQHKVYRPLKGEHINSEISCN